MRCLGKLEKEGKDMNYESEREGMVYLRYCCLGRGIKGCRCYGMIWGKSLEF